MTEFLLLGELVHQKVKFHFMFYFQWRSTENIKSQKCQLIFFTQSYSTDLLEYSLSTMWTTFMIFEMFLQADYKQLEVYGKVRMSA